MMVVARGIDGARSLALIALALTTLGACVTDDAQPTEIHVTPNVSGNELATLDLESYAVNGDDPGDDLCGMAAELPTTDVCSLVCAPDAFADRLRQDGMHGGSCYQFRCALSPTTTVSVGVCLP